MEQLPLYKERPRSPIETQTPRSYDAACKECALSKGSTRVCKPAGRPGGLLVVGEGASKHEDEAGTPFQDAGGTLLKQLLKKHWQGNVALDLATRCYPAGQEVSEKHIEACRGNLAHTLAAISPERIFALGPRAIASLTGRVIQPLTVRRGYSWLEVNGKPVPVFYMVSEREAYRNRFLERYLSQDIEWACKFTPPAPRWNAVVNLVTTSQEARDAIENFTSTAEGFAFDLEWAGFQFTPENRPLVFSASAVCGDGSVWSWDEAALANRGTFEPLKKVLEDPEQPKGGANVKADCHTLLSLDVRVQGVTFDTRLIRKVLDTDGSGALSDLQELVGMGAGKERMDALVNEAAANIRKEVTQAQKKKASKQASLGFETPSRLVQAARKMGFDFDKYYEDPKAIAYAFVPRDELVAYNATDTLSTARGAASMMLRLARSPAQQRIWYKVVQPAMNAIARVEQWGVPLDIGATQSFSNYLNMKVEEATAAIRAYGDFDIESPDQLAKVLYEEQGLTAPHETPGGKKSTDEEALEILKKQGHPLPAHVLTFRHYKKLSGYTADWLYRVRPDGRIHPSISLDGARCLAAGELVLTLYGYIPVEQVQVGDFVMTHKGRFRQVFEKFVNRPRPIFQVTLANGLSLKTTEDHEYMTPKGWVWAGDLEVGTPVQTFDIHSLHPLGWVPVASIKPLGEGQNFGLAVQEDHSHVTRGIVTHNSGRTSCIRKGTLIEIVRDVSQHPNGVPIEEVKVGDLAYCYDSNGALVLRRVLKAWRTGARELVRIHWRGSGRHFNGHVDVTPEHLVMLTSGVWCRADQLVQGDRVMSLSRGVSQGYGRLWPTGAPEITREHRFIYEQVYGRSAEHVHHRNGNKLDNRPENLIGMRAVDHLRQHGKEVSPELVALRIGVLRKARADGLCTVLRGAETANWLGLTRGEIEPILRRNNWSILRAAQEANRDFDTFKKYVVAAGFDLKELKRMNRVLRKDQILAGAAHARDARRMRNNHEVIRVEKLPDTDDVYDLKIDGEPCFIAGGICVHNSSQPNLQNVSSEKRDPVDGKLARDCFAAPRGFVLMQCDYGQLELRIAAELADDDVMRELFRSGVDFHLGTAKLISQLAWGIPPEAVTKVHRSGAKEFNFGLLYGKTDNSLAAQLGITKQAASAIRKAIFGAFAKLGVWHRRVTQEAKELGGCWTYWEGEKARWRPLLDLGDDSEGRRGFYINALNGAVNSPVQGTASDFCVASLARCVEAIVRKEMDAELILPIHDSLMFLVPERKVAEVSQQVHSIMTGFSWCKTPLEVDVEVGERWGSLERLKLGNTYEDHQRELAAEKALKRLDVSPP